MEKEYLIRQAPAKALLAFSTPMIIGNLFQQLYTMTDSVIVGQAVGESALAAVGASYALTNVFISVEEVVFANRIMRPAYKYLGHEQEYIPLEERG